MLLRVMRPPGGGGATVTSGRGGATVISKGGGGTGTSWRGRSNSDLLEGAGLQSAPALNCPIGS